MKNCCQFTISCGGGLCFTELDISPKLDYMGLYFTWGYKKNGWKFILKDIMKKLGA